MKNKFTAFPFPPHEKKERNDVFLPPGTLHEDEFYYVLSCDTL